MTPCDEALHDAVAHIVTKRDCLNETWKLIHTPLLHNNAAIRRLDDYHKRSELMADLVQLEENARELREAVEDGNALINTLREDIEAESITQLLRESK